MIASTDRNVPAGTYRSKYWLPARIARRLIQIHGAQVAGERVAKQLDRHARSTRADWAFRWAYWNAALVFIEKRAGRSFPTSRRDAA